MAQSPSSAAGSADFPASPPPQVNGVAHAPSVASSIAQSVTANGHESGNQSEGAESTARSSELSNDGVALRYSSHEDGHEDGHEYGNETAIRDAYNAMSTETPKEFANIETDGKQMPGIPEILEMLATMERKFQQMEARMDQLAPPPVDESPSHPQIPRYVHVPEIIDRSINAEVPVEDTITAFRSRASLVARAKVLHMAKKFPEWKDRVFEQAKAATCLPILEEGQETCPVGSSVHPKLWEVQNEWLYDFMYESIGPQFKEEIFEPPNRSAYILWRQIESYCSLVNEDDRRYLIQKLMTINAKNDFDYISTFYRYYAKIRKLDFIIPDWMAQDLLYLRVSERAREMIQSEIDAARNAKDGPLTLSVDKMVARVLKPAVSRANEEEPQPEPAPSVASSVANGPYSAGSKPDSLNASGSQADLVDKKSKVVCGYCSMPHHSEDGCFYKYPERTSPAWQKAHKSGIEFFRKKAEGREQPDQEEQRPATQAVKKIQIAQKPQPEPQPESKVKPAAKPESVAGQKAEPKPEPRQEAANTQPQVKSPEIYSEKLSCNYCGQKGHSANGCPFQFPDLETADWRQKNKHLIEFHARKDKLRKRKLERLKAKQAIEGSKPESSSVSNATRPASPENLLILDL
ncbi:hypothetical protein MGYG_02773 [Nannizzia gypsea CBS 118893]|uniref:CCHC-type domain-containing protein n=1 Tax=Arthroderma gypseum (strain ATCC MYA-4604 / CBS 118893) TaxID=535722 RepID=E4UP07_ARTGP|nr:hypothetical protein MGYG_02773 [Nannizzia gypsea CBS 118893]EFQ99760.1 hypothetical protein MGYG_02773 [Nannizzia gypsea CBS 118893]